MTLALAGCASRTVPHALSAVPTSPRSSSDTQRSGGSTLPAVPGDRRGPAAASAAAAPQTDVLGANSVAGDASDDIGPGPVGTAGSASSPSSSVVTTSPDDQGGVTKSTSFVLDSDGSAAISNWAVVIGGVLAAIALIAWALTRHAVPVVRVDD